MFGKAIVKWFMMASNLIVAIFMIMTLIGSVLSPEKIIFPAYFALIYPFTIFLNIFFLIFWLLARKWFFLLSLSMLLFSASQIGNTIPVNFGKTDSITSSKTIKILTYNTLMSGRLKKYTTRRPNMVMKYVLESDADIVCLQEFTLSENKEYLTLADIMRIFSKYPYKHIQYRLNERFNHHGIATFSKYPIINKQEIDYPSNFNLSIYSDIVIKGDTIRLINNHLESNKLTDNDKIMPYSLKDKFSAENLTGITLHFSQKLGAAYKLRAFQADVVARVIANSPYKVIVCGDFNDVPTSYAYTKVKGKLKDAFAETSTGLGWTYNERYYHFRIDYILYDSSSFTPILYKSDKVNYSDHFPVLCKLKFNDK
ncbi:MAG: endonuclease/exonuclease/phosphatase family protein [Paludibacter sp.]|nr:endonuclease/exonuclease/phosphatase family protein [Paludibacter sp.]